MMLVGMMLAEMDMKRVKTLLDKTLVYYVFMRLIGIGAILYGVTFLLPVDPLLKGCDGHHRRNADTNHHGTAGIQV